MTKQQHIKAGYLIPGQTWPQENRWLYDLCSKSRSHCEIGVYCGKSLWASIGGMPRGAEVYGVDDLSMVGDEDLHPSEGWAAGVLDETKLAIEMARHDITLSMIHKGSVEAAQDFARAGIKFDTVFIDGSHHYEHVAADIEAYLPLLRPGGTICGHDYSAQWPGVMDAVNYAFGDDFTRPAGRIWAHRLPA